MGLLNSCIMKQLLDSVFCDILNNPSARLITFTSALIIPDIIKTLSKICFLIYTLSDIGDSSNLIVSLSQTMTLY